MKEKPAEGECTLRYLTLVLCVEYALNAPPPCRTSPLVVHSWQWVLSPDYFNFPYPITLTTCHMLFSTALCFLVFHVFKVSSLKGVLCSEKILQEQRCGVEKKVFAFSSSSTSSR